MKITKITLGRSGYAKSKHLSYHSVLNSINYSFFLLEYCQNERNEPAGMHRLSEKNGKRHCTTAANAERTISCLLTTLIM